MTTDLATLVQELRATGEVTRMRVLCLLSRGELSVGELAQVLGQSQPRLSRHLKLLHAAGLIERLPEGAWVFYRLPQSGRHRAFIDMLVASADETDPEFVRDRERLEQVKAARIQAAQDYFSRVAKDWDELRALHYSEAEIERAVVEAAGEGPFDLMLDFGSGTGRMLVLFADRAERAEGIDLSHQMLTMARANLADAGADNVSVRHGDVTAAPYADGCADLVIIHQVLHYLDSPQRALAEAARVLRPGGRLVIVDFAPHTVERLREEHAHRRLGLANEDIERWVGAVGLTDVTMRRFDPPAREGGVAVALWTARRSEPDAAGSQADVERAKGAAE